MKQCVYTWKEIDEKAVYITIESGFNLIINADSTIYFSYNGVLIAKLGENSCRYASGVTDSVKRKVRTFIKDIANGKYYLAD